MMMSPASMPGSDVYDAALFRGSNRSANSALNRAIACQDNYLEATFRVSSPGWEACLNIALVLQRYRTRQLELFTTTYLEGRLGSKSEVRQVA